MQRGLTRMPSLLFNDSQIVKVVFMFKSPRYCANPRSLIVQFAHNLLDELFRFFR